MIVPWWVRIAWILTGVTWAGVSLLFLSDPAYQDPVTAVDWAAVLSYSLAWCFTAPSVLAVACCVRSRPVMIVACIAASGSLIAGSANALEDGLGLREFGSVYILGFFVGWLALPFFAATLWLLAGLPRLACLVGLLFVGIGLFPLGGGLIVLAGFLSVAVAPARFAPALSFPVSRSREVRVD
jgi:hypothetical protein